MPGLTPVTSKQETQKKPSPSVNKTKDVFFVVKKVDGSKVCDKKQENCRILFKGNIRNNSAKTIRDIFVSCNLLDPLNQVIPTTITDKTTEIIFETIESGSERDILVELSAIHNIHLIKCNISHYDTLDQ